MSAELAYRHRRPGRSSPSPPPAIATASRRFPRGNPAVTLVAAAAAQLVVDRCDLVRRPRPRPVRRAGARPTIAAVDRAGARGPDRDPRRGRRLRPTGQRRRSGDGCPVRGDRAGARLAQTGARRVGRGPAHQLHRAASSATWCATTGSRASASSRSRPDWGPRCAASPCPPNASTRWGGRPRNWAATALIYPGMAIRDHARAAIQLLSGDVPEQQRLRPPRLARDRRGVGLSPRRRRDRGGRSRRRGSRSTCRRRSAAIVLPDPPEGDDLVAAIRASLGMLDVMPDEVTMPAYGAVWRAVIGEADFSLHAEGPSGEGKTELLALCPAALRSGTRCAAHPRFLVEHRQRAGRHRLHRQGRPLRDRRLRRDRRPHGRGPVASRGRPDVPRAGQRLQPAAVALGTDRVDAAGAETAARRDLLDRGGRAQGAVAAGTGRDPERRTEQLRLGPAHGLPARRGGRAVRPGDGRLRSVVGRGS